MTCRYCVDGLALVGTHTYLGSEYEEYGPCPHCPAGKKLEFGEAGARRWGEEGYWCGRPSELVPLPSTAPLPPQENAKRAKELMAKLTGVGREMPR
jgi:hypothetical protein